LRQRGPVPRGGARRRAAADERHGDARAGTSGPGAGGVRSLPGRCGGGRGGVELSSPAGPPRPALRSPAASLRSVPGWAIKGPGSGGCFEHPAELARERRWIGPDPPVRDPDHLESGELEIEVLLPIALERRSGRVEAEAVELHDDQRPRPPGVDLVALDHDVENRLGQAVGAAEVEEEPFELRPRGRRLPQRIEECEYASSRPPTT